MALRVNGGAAGVSAVLPVALGLSASPLLQGRALTSLLDLYKDLSTIQIPG